MIVIHVFAGNVTGEPETMSEKDQRSADFVIDVFGLPLVRHTHIPHTCTHTNTRTHIHKQTHKPLVYPWYISSL